MTCILELNDSKLILSEGQRLLAQSPGYAYLSKSGLLLGQEARAQAQHAPLHTTNQFWHQLSQNNLSTPIGATQTAADFAYAQLTSLWSQAEAGTDELIFAIPSSFSQEQASLLLGISEACPFQVKALVDTAIASAFYAQPEPNARVFHLDIHLHKVLLTEITIENQDWLRGHVHEASAGILSLQAQLAHSIGSQFVQETRFDPLHEASAEQALYDSLPGWIDRIAQHGKAEIQIVYGQQTHQITLTAANIESYLAPATQLLIKLLNETLKKGDQLLVSNYFQEWIPALSEWRKTTNAVVNILPAEAVRTGILRALNVISEHQEGVPWVTHLPALPTQSNQQQTPAAKEAKPQPAPTHLLIGDQAFPIANTSCLLYSPASGFAVSREANTGALGQIQIAADGPCLLVEPETTALLLNGDALSAGTQALTTGDKLAKGSHDARCILVTTDGT